MSDPTAGPSQAVPTPNRATVALPADLVATNPATPSDAGPSLRSQLGAQIKQDPWGALAAVGLIASVIFCIIELRYLTTLNNDASVLLRNIGYGAWSIGLMMVVTFSVRTLRVRHILRSWLLGFFPVLAAVLIAASLTEFIADDGDLRTAFMVPLIEESFKMAPLLIIVVTTWLGKTSEPSITDFAITGYAIGAGFGLHEDGLWVRDIAGGFDGSWWGRLFPNFLNDDPFVIAHPGWTALVGLGVGMCWHFRRARFAWILGAIPLAVATVDHISINYRGDAGPRLRDLVFQGRLPAWLFIIGFVIALLIDLDSKKKGSAGLATRTVRDCIQRPRHVPAKARLPIAMLLIAQLRAVNGNAFRHARDAMAVRPSDDTPAAASPSSKITTF